MNSSEIIADFVGRQRIDCGTAYIGFSGGIDSTALLLLMLEGGICPVAVHFQHGIRGDEAEEDARWCENFCRKRGVECHVIHLKVPLNRKAGETTEEAARRLRMEAWEKLAEERPLPVFLAHHQDDALEEIFLRLSRGCNVTGLTGLRQRREIHNVLYLRPLLDCRKEELRQFLLQKGVTDWRTDSTNLQSEYCRNAVRNQLLPLFRTIFNTDAGLVQALSALNWDAEYLERQAVCLADSLESIESWQTIDQALLSRVFRIWRRRQDGVDAVPSRAFIQALDRALKEQAGTPQVLQLNPEQQVRIAAEGLRLVENTDAEAFDMVWNWSEQAVLHVQGIGCFTAELTPRALAEHGGQSFRECFSLADMPSTLTIRNWRPGDRMVPFGKRSGKKLQDIFTDGHIPREMRQRLPVVLAGETIIWIPGVRRAEFGRMAEERSGVCLAFEFLK